MPFVVKVNVRLVNSELLLVVISYACKEVNEPMWVCACLNIVKSHLYFMLLSYWFVVIVFCACEGGLH